jgi:uncharacterized protein (DUF305 family)
MASTLCWLTALAAIPVMGLAWRQSPHSHALRETDPPCWTAFRDSEQEMHTAMVSIKPSGHTDADFVALMLPHHESAIEMAKAELMCGTDPQMRRLAQEIVTDQESEIQLMRLWRQQHSAQPEGSPPESRANDQQE